MSLQELQKYTFSAKYARWSQELNRRETWKESVIRVKEMMLKRYGNLGEEVQNKIEWAYDKWVKKICVGSQRSLQFGGEPVFKHNARQYNCCASYCDRLRFFQETLYLLMCGCGTGFSVQVHHINKLPKFSRTLGETYKSKQFIIQDSIEGWADSVGVLLSSYFESPVFPDYYNSNVKFDYSLIRPAGAKLSSSSAGTAPGPEPLKRALDKVKEVIENRINVKEEKLRPIDAYDIIMHLSDAVLSGGIRRSATLCMFSKDDKEMYNAKIGDWFYKNPQRGRSNNSVVLLRDETSLEEFKNIIESTKNFGEPGFIWTDTLEQLFNPCVEASLYGYDTYGNSGWQFCNLCSINGKKVKSLEDFLIAGEAAAIIGTLQAGFTDFPYLGKVTEDITKREALLGVSMTGIMENPDILLNEENQRKVAIHIKSVNEHISKLLNINPASKLCVCKPEGTVSCVLGTSSGIHPHHARRYFRRVQANTNEPIYQHFKKYNSKACENSVWSNNSTDDVISFCVEVEPGSRIKNDMGAIDLLKAVKLTQKNWIKYGTVKERLAEPTLSHNVSNTITVKPEEWDEVTKFIFDNRKWFAGVSLLPIAGDKDYPQAPFCAVFQPTRMINHYGDGAMFVSGLIELSLESFNNDLWKACDFILGVIDEKSNAIKRSLKDKCLKFAEKYFEKDLKKLTYCMKDVYNWKLWLDLNRSYVEVNYEDCMELEDNTKPEESSACHGGSCELK